MSITFSANNTAFSFYLLAASSTSSSMINNLLSSQELLWTPYKLSLLGLERSLMAILISAILLALSYYTGLLGLLRDFIASLWAPREVAWTSREVEPFTLSESIRLVYEEALLWEASKETWEQWNCGVDLGLMELEERSCLNFSWSKLMTSDSTVDPRSLRLAFTITSSIVEKAFPVESPSSVGPKKKWGCKSL